MSKDGERSAMPDTALQCKDLRLTASDMNMCITYHLVNVLLESSLFVINNKI